MLVLLFEGMWNPDSVGEIGWLKVKVQDGVGTLFGS